MAVSPDVKRTIIIAGVATLTVVGVLIVVGLANRAVSPRASVPSHLERTSHAGRRPHFGPG